LWTFLGAALKGKQVPLIGFLQYVLNLLFLQLAALQKQVSARLTAYKAGIEKIGLMLKDRLRTNFVVVCIAEHLSINESRCVSHGM
jgi:arsenite-transporting ATPase